jgi:hypothetical protein
VGIYMLMLTGFWENAFRNIFFFIDKVIYKFIPVIYDFVQVLAKQELLKQPTIQKFANNVYALLAIFMLFRLAFVLLNAIIDPDKLADKSKGFGNIMTRFITGMFLIVIIPWAFEYAFKVQDMILSKNLMTKVVFGSSTGESTTAGYTLSRTALSAFYYCDNPVSSPTTDSTTGNVIMRYTCDLDNGYIFAFGSDDSQRSKGWSTLTDSLNTDNGSGDYKFYYSAGISTACGIVILLMLISLSIDVAVRVVKLAFLQLMTPVAVVGYIEPGGKRFQEWLKITISTYLNLFMRLLAISIAAYIISLVDPNKFTPVDLEGNPITSFLLSSFVRIFIILGCLIFIKEGPKMLSDILGIKDVGLGGLNPLKKLGGMAGAGFIGGATALGMKGVGGVAGGAAGGIAARLKGGSFWAGAGQGANKGFGNIKLKDAYKGGISGIGKSLSAGTFGAMGKGRDYAASKVTGKDEKLGAINSIKKGMASTASEMHVKAVDKHDTDRWEKMGKKGTYSPEYQKALDNIKNAKDQLKAREDAKSYWQGLYANNPTGSYLGADGNTYSFKEAYERSNGNVNAAQKNVDYFKGELDSMNKLDAFKSDAETKAFVDRMSSEDDYAKINSLIEQEKSGTLPYNEYNSEGVDKRKVKPVVDYASDVGTKTSGPSAASEFKTENGEVKTKSGIVMPGGYNPNDPRNK